MLERKRERERERGGGGGGGGGRRRRWRCYFLSRKSETRVICHSLSKQPVFQFHAWIYSKSESYERARERTDLWRAWWVFWWCGYWDILTGNISSASLMHAYDWQFHFVFWLFCYLLTKNNSCIVHVCVTVTGKHQAHAVIMRGGQLLFLSFVCVCLFVFISQHVVLFQLLFTFRLSYSNF